jgi:hypothetical protein
LQLSGAIVFSHPIWGRLEGRLSDMSKRTQRVRQIACPSLGARDAEEVIKAACAEIEPDLLVGAILNDGKLTLVSEEWEFVSPDEERQPNAYIVERVPGTDVEVIERLVNAVVTDRGRLVALIQGDGFTCAIAQADPRPQTVMIVDLSQTF